MGHVPEVDDPADPPVGVEERVVEREVVVDDLRPEARQRRRGDGVEPVEDPLDGRATGGVHDERQVGAQRGQVPDVPRDRPAGGRVEEAAGRATQPCRDGREVADPLPRQLGRRAVGAGHERQEPDEVTTAVGAVHRAPWRPVAGLARHGHGERRVDGGDVANHARLHLDDTLALARVRDLQDPAVPVVGGDPDVLVALADERRRRSPDPEQLGRDLGRLREAEARRGRLQDVVRVEGRGARHGCDGTRRRRAPANGEVGRPPACAGRDRPHLRLHFALSRDGGTADAPDSKSDEGNLMGVRISLPGPSGHARSRTDRAAPEGSRPAAGVATLIG